MNSTKNTVINLHLLMLITKSRGRSFTVLYERLFDSEISHLGTIRGYERFLQTANLFADVVVNLGS